MAHQSPLPPPRIGLRFEPLAPPEGADAGPSWIEHLARLEDLGCDVLWIAERPTQADVLVPSALLLCAAIAARTRRLRVATGLLPLPLHHPLRVAEDAATLDLVSGGRFELGLGLGSDPEGLESWGVPREDRIERFAEAVGLVRQAFSGAATSFQGRHFQLHATAVTPTPATPGGPPIWVGASRPEGQTLAASLGAGLMLPTGADPSVYLEAAAAGPANRQEAAAAGPANRQEAARAALAAPRLAWLLDPGADPVEVAPGLLERSAGALVDLVLPMAPGCTSFDPGVVTGLRARLELDDPRA